MKFWHIHFKIKPMLILVFLFERFPMDNSPGNSAVWQANPAAWCQTLQSAHRIDSFSGRREKKRNRFSTTVIVVHLSSVCDLLSTPTGMHSSSVSMTPSSSARHSRASKYSHCIIGINFPVHA